MHPNKINFVRILLCIILCLPLFQTWGSGYPGGGGDGGPGPGPGPGGDGPPPGKGNGGGDPPQECPDNAGGSGSIQLVSGAERFSTIDMEVKGLFPIKLEREYDSQATQDTPIGAGWDFSFVRRMHVYPDADKDAFEDASKPLVDNVKHIVISHTCGQKDLWVAYTSRTINSTSAHVIENSTLSNAVLTPHQPITGQLVFDTYVNEPGSNIQFYLHKVSGQRVNKLIPVTVNASNPELTFQTFQYTEVKTGMTYRFDELGRLAEKVNEQGQSHRYTYDTRGLLPLVGASTNGVVQSRTKIVSKDYRLARIAEYAADGIATGNYVDFFYNETTGRMTEAHASDGRIVSYVHDVTVSGETLGNLLSVSAPGDNISTYEYNDPNDIHNITSIREEANESPWQNTYDAQDRVIQQVRDLGDGRYSWLLLEYPTVHGETVVKRTIRDVAGVILADTTQTEQRTSFSGQWQKPEWIEDKNGKCRRITFDSNGRQSGSYQYNVNCATAKAGTSSPVTTTSSLADIYGRQLMQSTTLANGDVIRKEWVYDATDSTALNGQNPSSEQTLVIKSGISTVVQSVTYDRYPGSPTLLGTAHQSVGGGEADLNTSYTYDAKHRPLTVTDPDGQVIQFLYEGTSLYPTTIQHLDAGVPIAARKRRFAYDARGNITDIYDGKDNHTHRDYDDRNRVIHEQNALGEETFYTYTGALLTQLERGRTAAGEGHVTKFSYDGLGRTTRVEVKDDTGVFRVVQTIINDADGRPSTVTDALNRIWLYGYDDEGHLIREEDPDHHVTEHGYDSSGQRLWTRDAKLQVTNYVYNDIGKLERLEQCGTSPCAITQMEYDAAGRMLAVTDANSNRTAYIYDNAGRLRQETGARGTHTYTYDGANRVTHAVNGRGQEVEFSYYPWGGLREAKYYPNVTSTTATRVVSWTYDNEGNEQSVTDTAVQATALRSKTFDALNRMQTETNLHIPSKTISKNYDYDALGNIKTLGINDGSTLTESFHYNKRGWLDTAQMLSGPYTFNYYDDGRVQSRTQSNRARTQNYYPNGWLQNLTDNMNGSAQLTQSYTPDVVGNITTISRLIGAQTEQTGYGYDGLNRLTSASNPAVAGIAASENYTYDATGNRQSFTYDPWNRIHTALGQTYTYDADGNPQTSGTISLTHDHEGRMTQYGSNNIYTYDPEWRRLKKQTASGTKYFVWEQDKLIAEYNSSGTRMARYAYLPGDASPTEVELNNVIYQVRYDHLGTPLELVNAANAVVWRAHYEAFGKAVINDDVDNNGTHVEFNVRFPGQYFDSESGLNYNWHRFYSTETGRYLQSDPIGLNGGFNTFTYVGQNPGNSFDPWGLYPDCFRGVPRFSRNTTTSRVEKILIQFRMLHPENYGLTVGGNFPSIDAPRGGMPVGPEMTIDWWMWEHTLKEFTDYEVTVTTTVTTVYCTEQRDCGEPLRWQYDDTDINEAKRLIKQFTEWFYEKLYLAGSNSWGLP